MLVRWSGYVIAGGQRYLVPQLVSYKPYNGSESIPQNR